MERRMISPGFVEDALSCLRRRNIDPAEALARANIPPGAADYVSNVQYGALWLEIAELSGDEFFGLGARPMRPGSFKLMCHAVLHARTLEHALRRALTFLNAVLYSPTGELRQQDGQAEIVLTDDRDAPRPAFAYRTYWLILLGVLCWLIGRRIPLRRVDFACPAPINRRDYLQFFGAPVHFEQVRSRLIFNANYLTLPTIRDEKSLQNFLRGAPANILLRYRHDQGISARLRNLFKATQPADWPDFDAFAHDLKLSPATLRRRLRSEGQSFLGIRDEIRHALARDLLGEQKLNVAETAAHLGYAEPSAFYRAFVKWSGMTPAAFRQSTKDHSDVEDHD
ncbi:AraC family transcriptional regulator [Agrobacterium vitis]|uniref:AraC family transcriptional regulator n=1 Tax=Agrobacterium vitis TaxID=373 RepID=UPI001573DBAB|nr:AraC family transcriptional regulator [Agrobacterium vitis]NSZ20279.1 AraC family transcriptional regulator [Agrobacterium vitis]QZO07662.1 AraC family transcriptional regulator [Agrobacterium vitis]UJL91002.1 AraC family transcriptional regulator [Agrobacterium vitis]